MPELFSEAGLLAALPWAIGLVVLAIAVAVAAWALRRAGRGPRARARARAKLDQAGRQLVALDDRLAHLDLTVVPAPSTTAVRRTRMTAEHARDELYGEFRSAVTDDLRPLARAHAADRVTGRTTPLLDALDRAQAAHRHQLAETPPQTRLGAAQDRFASLRARMGDPTALVRDLRSRFDESEWEDAAFAADAAEQAAGEAEELISEAADRLSRGGDVDLSAANRALQRADRAFQSVDESYRLVLQSAAALEGERAAAHATVQQALRLRERLDPVADVRVRDHIDRTQAELAHLESSGARRPTETVVAIARLHERVDGILADTRTAQQATRAARLALAGTLAAARVQLAHAEARSLRSEPAAVLRAAVWSAEQQLGAARNAADPVSALAAARRALHAADEAASPEAEE